MVSLCFTYSLHIRNKCKYCSDIHIRKTEIEDMYACIPTTDDVNSFIVFQHICGQEIFTAYNTEHK